MRIMDAKEVARPSDYHISIELSTREVKDLYNWAKTQETTRGLFDSPPQRLIQAIKEVLGDR